MVDRIYNDKEDSNLTGFVFLDLHILFDMVYHNIMLKTFKVKAQVESYLTNSCPNFFVISRQSPNILKSCWIM